MYFSKGNVENNYNGSKTDRTERKIFLGCSGSQAGTKVNI